MDVDIKQESGNSVFFTSEDNDPLMINDFNIATNNDSDSILTDPSIKQELKCSYQAGLMSMEPEEIQIKDECLPTLHPANFNLNIEAIKKQCAFNTFNCSTPEESFECTTCDYKTTRKRALTFHMRSHARENPYSCSVCDFKATKRTLLKRHMRTHTDEKPDNCSITAESSKNDIICVLLETPDEAKKNLLLLDRPQPQIAFSKSIASKNTGKAHTRNFQQSWYSVFPWLCGSYYLKKLFCWPCLLVSAERGVWNQTGFNDFVNGTRAFRKHEDSAEHLKSAVNFIQLQKNRDRLADTLKENARLHMIKFNENVRLNRLFMQIPINAILYLSKQQLAFCGQDERPSAVNRGNFKELLKVLVDISPLEMQQHYEKIKNIFSGESETIQNELIECISGYIRDYIKEEIKEATFFAVQVNDATEITKKSQCSIMLRFINAGGTLVERFLGFYDVSSSRSADSLFNVLEDVLKDFNYKSKLIGQCYDGASVTSGHLNGLQTKIKDKAPQALFVHCLAHHLNLVLQQSFNKIAVCRLFFANVQAIPAFFRNSAKRTYLTDLIVGKCSGTDEKLLKLIVEEWNALKRTFQEIVHDPESDAETLRQSHSFLEAFNNFEFTFLAVVFNEIFQVTNGLFDVLHKKPLDVNACLAQIKSSCQIITGKRCKAAFKGVFDAATKKTSCAQSEAELFQKYKALFYEIVDHSLIELNIRFQDVEKLSFLCLVDSRKFEHYSKHFPAPTLDSLKECYPNIMTNNGRLKNELQIVYGDKRYRNMSVEKIIQLLVESDLKSVLKEMYKLFCLCLTLPSSSASTERGFSCLKRLKTDLRNASSQEKLSWLANISMHKDLLIYLQKTQPFYDDIINKFGALPDRKIDLYFKH